MFGRLYLLLAATCVAIQFTKGHSSCVNATFGNLEGFKTTLKPVVMKADVTHEIVNLSFPGSELGGCDTQGSAAVACYSENDNITLHFISQLTLFVRRTNAANDLNINAFAYCNVVTDEDNNS